MVRELYDTELEEVVGGWISSRELYNNRGKYIGNDFTLSGCGLIFGIHEDLYRVRLLDVNKDKNGDIKICYRILKNVSNGEWGTINASGESGDVFCSYYNSSSPIFLR